MEQYHELAKKYLKYQKHRTILTILGVALASGALFVILTLYFSNFINKRDKLREEMNYDMVFLTQDEAIVTDIVNKSYVKSAYAGTYYDEYKNMNYESALFINLKNPYKLDKYFSQIKDEYGVNGYINNSLASYYMQGYEGDMNYIILLMFLFLTMIFAIIGVGIIRNSIQLNTLEQVKDYGILRCVGSTFGQLKKIIFLMGFYQEMAGLVLGYVVGYIVATVMGIFVHIKVGLHLVPVVFVAIAFIGDLYFVMSENSKIVKKLTPVEAVRGNFAPQKQKIKRRGRSIYSLILGMEGDYAYKSLKANKGRYYKSVFAFGLGIACFIGISVMAYSLTTIKKASDDRFGDYPVYFFSEYCIGNNPDEIKSTLPSYDTLKLISDNGNIEEARTMHIATFNVVDREAFIDKFNDVFLQETYYGEIYNDEKLKQNDAYSYMTASMNVIGYEPDEYEKLEEYLIDGTLDVSENGIVMVQQSIAYPYADEENDTLTVENLYGKWYVNNDYTIGDTVKLYDIKRINEILDKYLEATGLNEFKMTLYDENSEPIYDEEEKQRRMDLRKECIVKAFEQAYEEGAYREYTVEGIVERDLTLNYDAVMQAVVPIDNFCHMTGLSREDSTGIKYSLKEGRIDSSLEKLLMNCFDMYECMQSAYVFEVQPVNMLRKSIRYISMFIIFVVLMSTVNIINTSASNLHLRRQELAQLRVIGVSKKRLAYIVILEGVITAISANVLGNLLGYGLLLPMKKGLNILFHIPLSGTLTASVLGLVVSTLILCGSLYVPIKRMGNAVIDELNASGD